MKFSVSKNELQHKMAIASKVIMKKNAYLILDYVRVTMKDGVFHLTGASSENQLSVPLDMCQSSTDGFQPFCLDTNRFLGILGTLPEQPIEIEVNEKRDFLTTIRYQGGDFRLSSMPADGFPEMPRISATEVAFRMPASVLLPAVKAAQTCTADDEVRRAFSCVALDVMVDGVTIVGTDGRKMYRYTYTHGVPFLLEGRPSTLLLPRTVVSALSAAVGRAAEVCIRADGKRIEVSADGAELSVCAVEGKYPNYNAVFPSETPYHAAFSVRDLVVAAQRASLADAGSGMVRLEKKKGSFALCAASMETGSASTTTLPCEDETLPDGFTIGLSGHLLALLLGNISTEEVVVGLVSPERPITLREKADNSPLTELLMPMRVDSV